MRKQTSYSYKILFSIIITITILMSITSITNQFVYGEEEQTTSFSVIIPKTILLSGEKTENGENKGEYVVIVKGNINNLDTINVKPNENFLMQQIGKKDIVATIAQDKTSWTNEDFDTIGNGVITTTNMTAGNWYGQFNFDIKLNKHIHNYEITNTIEATCETNGVNIFTCICGDEYEETIISTGHNYEEWTITKEPTCNIVGEKQHSCSICGNIETIEIETIPHEYEYNYCINCGNQEFKSGLYDENNNLVYSWEELINIGLINVDNGILTTIKNESLYDQYGELNGTLYIDNSVTTIGKSAFDGEEYLVLATQEITIPSSVTTIENSAFYLNNSIKTIVMSDSVTSIGSCAFSESNNLETIRLSNNITIISNSAFENCYNLSNINLPTNLTTIETYAFGTCYKLPNLTFPETLTTIGECAFIGCDSITDLMIPNSVTTIGTNAFLDIPHITYNGDAMGSPWGALAIN